MHVCVLVLVHVSAHLQAWMLYKMMCVSVSSCTDMCANVARAMYIIVRAMYVLCAYVCARVRVNRDCTCGWRLVGR